MKISYEFIEKKVEWYVLGDAGYFTTDETGRGIFRVHDGNRSQLLGTAQFSVAGLTKSSARAKIRKFMSAR